MNKPAIILLTLCAVTGLAITAFIASRSAPESTVTNNIIEEDKVVAQEKVKPEDLFPMKIEALRSNEYPGGNFVIEETLSNGTNYQQFVASYKSEGLKIYGLLTVPLAPKPDNGYPAIIFVHGYIPPKQYSTINNYPTYQAALAKAGFVTFKPDLRGHGNSEGEPVSAHYSEKYVIDTLNALEYLKMHEAVDAERIGYWGHSNGGEIGLRVAVVSTNIKAYSLWAGVVGSYEDMFETFIEDIPFLRDDTNPLIQTYNLPSKNPEFWNRIDPYNYLGDIKSPIQLQHGTNDTSVPIELSVSLKESLEKAQKDVEYYKYPGDDHNISGNAGVAWQRTINFFEEHL